MLFDGYQNAEEAFKESSEILVNFNVGSASGFYYDLGYSSMGLTLQDLDEVYCAPDLTSGFGPSVYSSNIKCDILLGPSTGATSTSFATVRIRDFTGVLAGVPMKISIPIYTPDGKITIFKIINLTHFIYLKPGVHQLLLSIFCTKNKTKNTLLQVKLLLEVIWSLIHHPAPQQLLLHQ